MGTIKDFLDKFPVCPKCGAEFDVRGTKVIIDGCIGIDLYNVRLTPTTLYVLFYPTDPISFVDEEVDFSINLSSYSVVYKNEQTFKDFVELGIITIDLNIGCSNCACETYIYGFEHGFSACFKLAYDMHKNDFSHTFAVSDGFSHEYEGVVYNFTNLHMVQQAIVGTHNIDNKNVNDYNIVKTPIIPLDNFDFSDPSKVFSKLQNILILI